MAGWGLSDFTSAISTIQDTVKSLEKQVDNALGVDEATLRQGIILVYVRTRCARMRAATLLNIQVPPS